MLITTGKVNGHIIELTGDNLPDGATVTILAPEDGETFEATAQEEAKLIAAMAEADRGDAMDGSALIEQISKS